MNSLIIKRAEHKVRQQIFGGVVMFVCALMVLNTFNLLGALAGNTINADVTFNITSGDMQLTNGPVGVTFGSNSYGASGTIQSANKASNVVAQDYRGTGTAWVVSVNANDLSDGTNTIYANKLTIYQSGGTLTNIQNCTTSRIGLGATDSLESSGATLMNGSTQASGIVQYDNGYFNLTLGGAESAGVYGGKIIFTIVGL
jgi:hypothetical protein